MKRAAILSFSRQGGETARRIAFLLKREYDCGLFAPEKHADAGIAPIAGSLCTLAGRLMKEMDALVFVGACGIAVRAIAPHIRSKTEDPAVICVDERGRFSISLLSGHIGGGNRLANAIAAGIGATPVITTATDVNGRFAVDAWAAEQGFVLGSMAAAKDIAATILERDVPICADRFRQGYIRGWKGMLGFRFPCGQRNRFRRRFRSSPVRLRSALDAGAARQKKRLSKPFLRCLKKTDWICAPCVKQLPLT